MKLLRTRITSLVSSAKGGLSRFLKNPRHRRILSGSLILGVSVVIAKMIGMIKQMIIAAWFGTSSVVDAFYMALLVSTFVNTVTGTALGSAVIPTYVQEKQLKGVGEVQKSLSEATLLSAALFTAFAAAEVLIGPYFLSWIGRNLRADQVIIAANLFYILVPCTILCGPIYLWSAIYNAENRFAIPALGPAVSSIVIVLVIYMGAKWGIYSLAAGTLAGFAVHGLLLWAGRTNIKMNFVPGWYGGRPSNVQIGKQYGPMLAATLLHNSSMLVDQTMAANLGAGSLTALNYAWSVVFAFLGIGSAIVGTVFLPHFSAMSAKGQRSANIRMLKQYSLLLLFGSLPPAAALFFLGEPIVMWVFERGEFSRNDTLLVSQIVQMFSFQIPFYLLGILGVRFLSAELNNSFTFRTTIVGAILNVVLDLVLIEIMGLKGIALSTSIVYAVTTSLIFGKIALTHYGHRSESQSSGPTEAALWRTYDKRS